MLSSYFFLIFSYISYCVRQLLQHHLRPIISLLSVTLVALPPGTLITLSPPPWPYSVLPSQPARSHKGKTLQGEVRSRDVPIARVGGKAGAWQREEMPRVVREDLDP